MAGKKGDRGGKMLTGLATAGAAFVAKKVVHKGWRLATGKEPPESTEDERVPFGEALAWAVFLSVSVGVARMLAARATRKAFSHDETAS